VKLTDYAEQHKDPKRKCWVCSLPQIDEVNEALRTGHNPGTIAGWLREDQGVDLGHNPLWQRISRHFKNGHADG
jgi:hypothetical protein